MLDKVTPRDTLRFKDTMQSHLQQPETPLVHNLVSEPLNTPTQYCPMELRLCSACQTSMDGPIMCFDVDTTSWFGSVAGQAGYSQQKLGLDNAACTSHSLMHTHLNARAHDCTKSHDSYCSSAAFKRGKGFSSHEADFGSGIT